MERIDNRNYDQIRSIKITKDFTMHADACVLIEVGNTKVICSAFVEDRVPPFLKGSGSGWITAEYSMLPSSTTTRKQRDINRLKLDSRSAEIQRLIGRSLRSVVNLKKLKEKTISIDCDVIQADGGTRVASITGAMVALYMVALKLKEENITGEMIVDKFIAAISMGVVNDECLLDLCYKEDSNAIADMNLVMDEDGGIVELGITSEQRPVSEEEFNQLMVLGKKGIKELIFLQKEILGIK